MKFTAIAILPAVLWTCAVLLSEGSGLTQGERATEAIVLFALWGITWPVIGVYWVGRIWRAATRDRRSY